MLPQVKTFWGSLSVVAKVLIVLVVIISIGIVVTNLSGAISQWRSKRADAAVAAKEGVIKAKQDEIDRLNREAAEKEAKSDLIETENTALKELITEKGGKIEKEQEKLDAAMEEFKRDQSITDASVPDAVRRERVCAKLRSLGFQCQ